jgi:ferrochelatase
LSPTDAILLVGFGGPEGPAEVMPFLENVMRGRRASPERLREVATHYEAFGGVSPINAQMRALCAALEAELARQGPALPVYWGNRNWHPMLRDTLARMAADGVGRALAFVTSAYSSYSGCRQYLEDIRVARDVVGAAAPEVAKLRVFYDHPGFVAAHAEHVHAALQRVAEPARGDARLLFTAHSLPAAMAAGSDYEAQLREACRLVAGALGRERFDLAFQSRSGPPTQAWLGPDVEERLRELAAEGARHVVLSPIGFVSDHMEVVYDLDVAAAALAKTLGIGLVRAATPGTHPAFVAMIRELILERTAGAPRRALGRLPAAHDDCAPDCCRIS